MGLKGDIKDFNIPEIIQLLGLQSKTGILTVRNGTKKVRIYFVDGNIARVDPDRTEHRMLMGEMLIAYGKLTPEQLEEALEAQKGTGKVLGEVLLQKKLVSKEDIQQVIQKQIYETTYQIFQWKEGTFEFESGEKPRDLKILPALSLDQLLLNVSWMTDEWKEIEEIIPTMEMIFEKIPKKKDAQGKGEKGEEQEKQEKLTTDQKLVYELVDGTRTVREIMEASLMGRFETCRILSELLKKGLIRRAKIQRVPITAGEEIKRSGYRALTYSVSVLLIAAGLFFSFRYALSLLNFRYEYAPDLGRLMETQIQEVVVPTLYERYLTYKLMHHEAPLSLKAFAASGVLSKRESKVLTPMLIKTYEEKWEQKLPF